MSMRNRFIALGAVVALMVVAFVAFPFRSNRAEVKNVRAQQATVQEQIDALRVRLERLKELQRNEPALRAESARFGDALPSEPRLPDFILQVQESANLAGVDFLSIAPTLPAPFSPATAAGAPATSTTAPSAGGLQAISVAVSTTGGYADVVDFVTRLEQLKRAVRVNTFTLSPGGDAAGAPGGSPKLSVAFQVQMFVESPAAATAAVAAPAGAGGAASSSPPPSPRSS